MSRDFQSEGKFTEVSRHRTLMRSIYDRLKDTVLKAREVMSKLFRPIFSSAETSRKHDSIAMSRSESKNSKE